jgi:hypothetical protein
VVAAVTGGDGGDLVTGLGQNDREGAQQSLGVAVPAADLLALLSLAQPAFPVSLYWAW